jgi:capsular polysaccharide biosynthesis protein
VKDTDRTGPLSVVSVGSGDGQPGRIWTFDEITPDEGRSAADLVPGPTSVGFLRAALRRGLWLWCATAVIGMLAGFAVFRLSPPSYQASTSVLLGFNNLELPADAALDDQSIAQSRTVAADALRTLGMRETPAKFISHYSVTVVTSRVLLFTVKATSGRAAVRQANALASAFLGFQKQELQAAAAEAGTLLQRQMAVAQQNVDSISKQISRVSAQPSSPARDARLSSLRAESSRAASALTALKTSSTASDASLKISTETLVGGTRALDPAALTSQSRHKLLLIYVASGLIAGLALGVSIVAIRALVSDRLRRRDDIARAFGAPVTLSVGKVRLRHSPPGPRGLAVPESAEIRRIVAHLVSSMRPGLRGTAALAVVPVDDPQVAALSLASLAWGYAQSLSEFRVVVADLYPGAPAARLLEVQDPGVHEVSVEGVRLVVAVPDGDDVAPVGPLDSSSPLSLRRGFREAVADASSSADLLLTLAALDPATGGQHIAGWTRASVAVVTAGRSSAERIHAVGEMIRLSGAELTSAVLVGADKTDQSLGLTDRCGPPASAGLSQG